MNKNNPMYDNLIKRHEKCIQIIQAIIHFERKKKSLAESLKGIPGTFPELRREYMNDIDTIDRCIDRLKKKYSKVILNECN